MTPDGRDKNIDSVLELFDTKVYVTTDEITGKVSLSERDNTISQMLSIGLIQLRTDLIAAGGPCYILTSSGIDVKRSGSWTQYLSDRDEEKKANRQLIDSSITANWLNKWLLIATSFFSLIAVGITTADYQVHEKELEVAVEELRLHKLEIEKEQYDSLTCPCKTCKSSRQSDAKADSSQVKSK